MKTILSLLLATFFSVSASAYGEGRLTISVAIKNTSVIVDGRTYQIGPDNAVNIENIRPGNHTIKIYDSRRGRTNERNHRNDRSSDVFYSATINVRSFQHVDIMVNRFGKTLVDERDIRSMDDRRDDYYDDRYRNNSVISAREFSGLVNEINRKWFSSQKKEVVKDAFQKEYFNTAQIKELLQLFHSENDKLELAKLAYNKTVDNRNFYKLYNVFTFQSSRDELDRYIRDRR